MAKAHYPTAQPFLPKKKTLQALAEAAKDCEGCPLYKGATHTVFGEGPARAQIMIVGEQPGEQDDMRGKPFIGPAGRVLDRALSQAHLSREHIYLTNAVKHFKSKGVDGERQALTPTASEVHACKPWLQSEIEQVQPQVVVALGAVATRSLLGDSITIREAREQWLHTIWGQHLVVSYHPSAPLRVPLKAESERIFNAIVEDLRRAQDIISTMHPDISPPI